MENRFLLVFFQFIKFVDDLFYFIEKMLRHIEQAANNPSVVSAKVPGVPRKSSCLKNRSTKSAGKT